MRIGGRVGIGVQWVEVDREVTSFQVDFDGTLVRQEWIIWWTSERTRIMISLFMNNFWGSLGMKQPVESFYPNCIPKDHRFWPSLQQDLALHSCIASLQERCVCEVQHLAEKRRQQKQVPFWMWKGSKSDKHQGFLYPICFWCVFTNVIVMNVLTNWKDLNRSAQNSDFHETKNSETAVGSRWRSQMPNRLKASWNQIVSSWAPSHRPKRSWAKDIPLQRRTLNGWFFKSWVGIVDVIFKIKVRFL